MKILIKNPDGTVGIMHPILNCGLTIEEIAKKDSGGVPYEIVDDSIIPSDRTFRNAWKHDLTIDITMAQEITKERLRRERAPLLEKLDIDVMKNITDPVKLATIEEQKQILRDLPQQVDNLTTVEELKAIKAEQPAI
jgi:hypothetical protein